MRIATLNANGLRACLTKGLRFWLSQHDIDVLCIQESKAQLGKLDPSIYNIPGYSICYKDAIKPGYSGVVIYTRIAYQEIPCPWQNSICTYEGRAMAIKINNLILMNIYMPSGTSGDHRQQIKWELLQHFSQNISQNSDHPFIIVGDFNIAHQTIDLRNWRSNHKKSGFLDYERKWFTDFLKQGWTDSLRYLRPEAEEYTWWSLRSKSRERNVGWRIDYQIINSKYANIIKNCYIDSKTILSDHAAYVVEYKV